MATLTIETTEDGAPVLPLQDALAATHDAFCRANRLENMCAYDLLTGPKGALTDEQREWLHSYIELWEASQALHLLAE